MTTTRRLPLEGLVFEDALWPRVSLDKTRVEHLADVLRAGQRLPSIKVQKGTAIVLGGRHTVLACRLIGEPTYFVELVDVPPDERLLFAYREDAAAALPYSAADVRSVARRLYQQRSTTNGDLPNVVTLAAELGRSQRTVAHWVEDLVAARERGVEVKRAARILAVHAFNATQISTRRIAAFVGISHKQVATDCQMAISRHLADPEIVTEGHSLIHLAIAHDATIAETEAARDWLIAQTDPDALRRRDDSRAARALAIDLEAWATRAEALTIPETIEQPYRDDIRHSLDALEGFLQQLKARTA